MIRIQQDKLGIAAYDEAEGLLLVGEATRNAARRVWTVRVGDTVRYRHRRRSAARTLHKLATDALTARGAR